MGTNYYRIPKVDDVNRSYQKFMSRLQEMDRWDPAQILNGYHFIDNPDRGIPGYWNCWLRSVQPEEA